MARARAGHFLGFGLGLKHGLPTSRTRPGLG